jgi:hypothetical protein
MIASIQIRSVYGEEKAYPMNAIAEGFAAIAGTKTLTRHTMRNMLAMGVRITEVDRHGGISRTYDATTINNLPAVR